MASGARSPLYLKTLTDTTRCLCSKCKYPVVFPIDVVCVQVIWWLIFWYLTLTSNGSLTNC